MMTLPPLEIRDVVAILTALFTIGGVVWALRSNVSELKTSVTEILRQVQAVHKRLDDQAKELTRIDRKTIRLEERFFSLRNTQRFKLRSDAQQEQDIFADDDVD